MAPHDLSVPQLFDLAVRSHRGKQLDVAERQYRELLTRDAGHIGALRMLALLLATTGRAREGLDLLRKAIGLQPDDAELHYNLAKVLKQVGERDQSIDEYRRAIALRPQFPEALNNLGNVLQEKGNHQDALEVYNNALALRPNYPEAHFNLGRLLHEMDQTDEAIAEYQRAIALRPQYPEAHNNLGLALAAQQRIDEAIAAFREAIRLRPGYIEAMANLGNALKDRGGHEEAIACFRAAAAGNPDPRFAGNILMSLLYHPGYDKQTIYREHVAWDQMYAQPLAASIGPHLNDPDPNRRLRVGYVSPHLNEHVVGRYLMPLLEHHDHARFEIFCYNDSHREDAASRQIQSFSDEWRTIAELSEEQVAEQIRADRIDLLVDLTLHMNQNRLLVFARKPAPVQITWLGYPGTTGLSTMDYRISDPYLDPPRGDDDDYYSEKTLRLPHTYWCYPPPADDAQVEPLPALSNGFVTFGCLSTFCKITAPIVDVWASVLRTMPSSRLIVLAPQGTARERLARMLAERGVDSTRFEAISRQPFGQYLRLYNRIDVGLDTFPYNGHTTSLDSLWMGVPFVTLKGPTAVSRGGASILSNVGLPELIACNPPEFVESAIRLASDLPRVTELRSTLRQRMRASALMDARQFARDMEDAYRGAWREWCHTLRV